MRCLQADADAQLHYDVDAWQQPVTPRDTSGSLPPHFLPYSPRVAHPQHAPLAIKPPQLQPLSQASTPRRGPLCRANSTPSGGACGFGSNASTPRGPVGAVFFGVRGTPAAMCRATNMPQPAQGDPWAQGSYSFRMQQPGQVWGGVGAGAGAENVPVNAQHGFVCNTQQQQVRMHGFWCLMQPCGAVLLWFASIAVGMFTCDLDRHSHCIAGLADSALRTKSSWQAIACWQACRGYLLGVVALHQEVCSLPLDGQPSNNQLP
jgi:hypothetical protein